MALDAATALGITPGSFSFPNAFGLSTKSSNLDVMGKDLLGKGGSLLTSGIDTLARPLSYYQGLLGSRQEALSAAAPEISTIKGQFATAAKAVSEFTPRGGGRVARSSELPFTEQAAIQDVITKQRPQAAQGITDIGQLLSALGLSVEQFGISEEQLSLEALLGASSTNLQQKQQSDAKLGALGSAVGSTIIAGILI